MSLVSDRINRALVSPIIILCASGDPKTERVTYMNYVRKQNLNESITILYRQEYNRLIIGPKDFQIQTYVGSFNTCSQEELTEAWETRHNIEQKQNDLAEVKANEQKIIEDTYQELNKIGLDALATLGFGQK